MTNKLYEVDDCLKEGGVIWTCDRPSQPESPVKVFCYRPGRQFAVSGTDEILPVLLQLQEKGLALGIQSVPERGNSPRVIKWRGLHAQGEAAAALARAQSAACKSRLAGQIVAEERSACFQW